MLNPEQIKKIAIEYGRVKGAAELSRELGVSRQRIQQIATTFRKKGVNVPRMRCAKTEYEILIKELRIEHPELFKEEYIENI